METRREIKRHLSSIHHVGALVTDSVEIPRTAITLQVTRPLDTNVLLDQSAADPEQNLPYWAEIWPSGIALAGAIAADPATVAGEHVLELGCGLGITAAIAVAAGAILIASDYAPESLALCAVTCLRHTGRTPELVRANWRDATPAFLRDHGAGFQVVLAADALYERRDIAPLLDLIDVAVARDGTFWLAEPQRPPSLAFLRAASDRGWHGTTTEWHGPWPDPADAGVRVRIHRLSRSKSEDSLDNDSKTGEKRQYRS